MSPLFDRRILLGLVFILLVGCSGGESGTGAQDQNQTTVGEITGFGSIYVNGIHFETDQVELIEVDDDVGAIETDLEVGMVVRVIGTVSADGTSGVARQVLMTTGVEGLVFENNYGADQTINVMGQTINITNDTHFNSSFGAITDFGDLVPNQTAVEVHGFTDGFGEFFATMINVVQDNGVAPEVKLLGKIQGDGTSGSFDIGNITVVYDGSTSFDDGLQVSDLIDGFYVEVESENYSGTGDVLATEIESADLNDDEGSSYELEGIVTDITNIGINEFSLNGQRVLFDPMTVVFEGGDLSDIQLETELEVEGVFEGGVIQAYEISFHTESETEIEGAVMDPPSGNTLLINGVTLIVNELTSYEDEVDETNQYFGFNDITQNMILKVKYYVDTDSMQNIATQIDRTGP